MPKYSNRYLLMIASSFTTEDIERISADDIKDPRAASLWVVTVASYLDWLDACRRLQEYLREHADD